MSFPPVKTSWVSVSPGLRWLRKEYFDKRVVLVDEEAAIKEGLATVREDHRSQVVNPQGREGSNQEKEVKMSAETMTDKLTGELTGKTNVLNSRIADLNTKIEAVFTDAHAAVDAATAHVDKVAAAVARLKETLPT